MVVENIQRKRKQSTLPFTFSVAEKKRSVCVDVSDDESNNEDSEVLCSICHDVDDPTETLNITWVDCDWKIWLRKSCWLCVAHIKWICWQWKKIHIIVLSFNLVHNPFSNIYFLPSFHCKRMDWGRSWLLSRGQVIFKLHLDIKLVFWHIVLFDV